MKTIGQEEAELCEKMKQVNVLVQQSQALYKEVSSGYINLGKRIQGGETTGDLLRDLVINRYVFPTEERLQRFRNLNERIEKHQGQYILIVQVEKNQICFRGPGRGGESDFGTKIELTIGVLSAEALILDPPKNQFFFWPQYRYQGRRDGQNAIFFMFNDKPAPPPEQLLAEFESVTDAGFVEVKRGRRVFHRVQLFACRNLR